MHGKYEGRHTNRMKHQHLARPTPDEIQVERVQTKKASQKRRWRLFRNTVASLIVATATAVLITTLYVPVLRISGNSMDPTFKSGDIVVCVKASDFQAGDLCAFYWQNRLLLKRVIGMPGDSIVIDDQGAVSINGEQLEEPYVSQMSLGKCDLDFPYQVPSGSLFVLGDNRSLSSDSRCSQIGCVETNQIVGRVLFRIWPLNGTSN